MPLPLRTARPGKTLFAYAVVYNVGLSLWPDLQGEDTELWQ